MTLEESIRRPGFLIDPFNPDAPAVLHVGNLALHEFVNQHHRLPHAWNTDDAQKFVEIATDIHSKQESQYKVGKLDLEYLKKLSYVAEGNFGPIAAFLGGFVAQEVLKSISGKFSPLKQWVRQYSLHNRH